MKKRRQYAVIRQYDYTSKAEFEKHVKEMESKGYVLVKGFYGGQLDPSEMDGEVWTYTASFIKSDML